MKGPATGLAGRRVRSVDNAQDLVTAVNAADVRAVEAALRGGASPDTVTADYSKTPVLTTAAQRGATEIVEKLLAAGASIDVVSGWERTPLRAAAMWGHVGVVRLLLTAGADPNPRSERGSILMEAVASTRHRAGRDALETVSLLLDAGAVVRPQDDSAVVLAVAADIPAAALRLLLDRGADPNATRSDGTPAIVLATIRREEGLVDELIRFGADVDAPDRDGRTALMHAVERGLTRMAACLLCAGADKDKAAPDGSSAHLLAKAWGRQVIQLMMGDQSVGHEVVNVPRKAIYQRAEVVQLLGDGEVLEKLAALVDHAIDDLGDDEFEILVGSGADEGRRVADRLRNSPTNPVESSTIKRIDITRDEQRLIRGALLNLAYGPPMEMLGGMTRSQAADLFEDFDDFFR